MSSNRLPRCEYDVVTVLSVMRRCGILSKSTYKRLVFQTIANIHSGKVYEKF
jgi:hypothetical protein